MDASQQDLELLARWSNGDQHAGSALIDRHFASLYRFFLNKVGDAADDLVQQTLLACVSARDRFRGESSFRTFLFAIARQCLLVHLRQFRRDARIDFSTDSVHDLGTSPTGALARLERDRILQIALRKIPADLQIALELHYWDDMSGPDIAEVLELPLDTAYSRLRRAKEKLREAMQEEARLLGSPVTADEGAFQDELRDVFLRVGNLVKR
jgi:RNA polymerase sigma-70 factor (ECF subfamily)